MSEYETDHVAWITGGGSGIGEAMAIEYGSRGSTVAVSGRRIEPLEETVRAIEEVGGRGIVAPCDVTDVDELRTTVDDVVDRVGGLDVAVANAGYSVSGDFLELEADAWRGQLETNVVGLAMTARFALPHLKERDGRLALMGSVAGTVGLPENGPYSASKFAVRGIGQTLTAELAGTGVSCTTLMPGFVESDIGRVDNQGDYHPDWEDRRPRKLMWPADRAARSMVRAIDRRRSEAVITGHGKVVTFLANHAPRLMQFVLGRFR